MKLLITDSTLQAREWQVTTTASLGRAADNTILLEDTGVGRQHAVLERRGDGDWIRDLGSTNGTFVNGLKIRVEQRLQTGDVISLGGSATVQVVEARSFPSLPGITSPSEPFQRKDELHFPFLYLVMAGVGILLVITISGLVIRQSLRSNRFSFRLATQSAQSDFLHPNTTPSKPVLKI